MGRGFRRVFAPDLIAWANMMKLLSNKRFKGYTVDELVEATGFNVCTVGRYLGALHQVHAAYVEGYELDGRGAYSIRRWKLGQDDDAVPPVRPRHVRAREQRHREALNPKLRLNAKEAAHAVNDAGDARTGARDTAHEQGKAVLQKRDDVVFQREKQKFEGANHDSYSS